MTVLTRRYRDPTHGAVGVAACGLAVLLGALYQALLIREPEAVAPDDGESFTHLALWVPFLAVLCYWRGYRVVGLMPLGLTATAAALAWVWQFGTMPAAVSAVFYAGIGVTWAACLRYALRGLRAARSGVIPPRRGFPAFPMWDRYTVVGLALLLVGLVVWADADPNGYRAAYPYLAAVGWLLLLAFAWLRLFRPFFELCLEPLFWLGYRIRPAGPGVDAVPYSGPLLVIANHACFWDPAFLGKVLPRPMTPMMTAKYFDLWFLRPLMVHTFRVIRVEERVVRRETPEVAEAVAALDRGECVVIFPEGYLRRKEDQQLRRFGRGVWEILKARPETPVVAGWIEGGWGTCVSYKGGPPLKGKKIDIRRPIGVGLSAPATVKAELLADHLRTRLHLMNAVSAARAHLGLDPLPPFEPLSRDDDEPAA